jgi:osmotically inducible lipoprotein OsmB
VLQLLRGFTAHRPIFRRIESKLAPTFNLEIAMVQIFRMSALALAAQLAVVTLGLLACSSPPSRQDIGIASGAVVGGVVGSVMTGGSTLGTAAGAAGGALVGKELTKQGAKK